MNFAKSLMILGLGVLSLSICFASEKTHGQKAHIDCEINNPGDVTQITFSPTSHVSKKGNIYDIGVYSNPVTAILKLKPGSSTLDMSCTCYHSGYNVIKKGGPCSWLTTSTIITGGTNRNGF